MNKRLEYIDIAKGIGIVLVVCSHTDALGLMWPFMGMFVPVFYFCSGYTFSRKGTIMEMMKKRFRKLFVPYLFFNVLLFCVFAHFSIREIVGVLYSRYCLYPLDVTPNIKFLTSGNYPMWFLTSMIVSYFLFYLIVFYERYKYYLIGGYAITTILFIYCPILLPWSIDTAFLTALFMYMGMIARRHEWIHINKWLTLFIITIYICLQCYGGEINLSVRMYGTSVIMYFLLGVLGSFGVLVASKMLVHTIAGKLFMSLGRHSLTIFCVQMAFIVWARNLFFLFFPSLTVGYLSGIFEIFIALIAGWSASVLIHKNKYLKILV